ncbi:MAG TPA: FAD-dependent oxidoreductase [Candidatus Limnocylindria bacterium]|nr:FAD-dependent oxidoreductase [Candidatus Limnocylindria bacterium]
MARVVIAGGGFGGIAAAVALTREVGPGTVTLIDRRPDFVMGLRKSWAVLGLEPLERGLRRLDQLDGVDFVQAEITSVQPTERAVETADGMRYAGDALVLALGAEQAPQLVPGLAEHGINVWDRAEVERARVALEGVREGRLLIGVFGMPHSCPPAPYEFALLARDTLPAAVEVAVFTPAPMALAVAGPEQSARLEALLGQRGVSFLPGHKAEAVSRGVVQFADGSQQPFDVLFGVPPHRCPSVLVEAGLAGSGGWLKPDPRTLETAHDGVYAVGDCTAIALSNGLALPKAGVFAHAQGEAVAARIAATLAGRRPTATFAGEGMCYLETGRGEAAKTFGSFLADPPQVQVSSPDAATMEEKREFERTRLAAWFGR